jgi:hypothetical protein
VLGARGSGISTPLKRFRDLRGLPDREKKGRRESGFFSGLAFKDYKEEVPHGKLNSRLLVQARPIA